MIVKFIGILMTDSYLGGGIPSFLELRLGMWQEFSHWKNCVKYSVNLIDNISILKLF